MVHTRLGPEAHQPRIDEALAQRGDGEVVRRGTEISWEHTLVGGGAAHLLAGALSASRLRPWVRAGEYSSIPLQDSWEVLERAHLAVLDRRFAAAMSSWPEVTASILDRMMLRSQWLVIAGRSLHSSAAVWGLPHLAARCLQ